MMGPLQRLAVIGVAMGGLLLAAPEFVAPPAQAQACSPNCENQGPKVGPRVNAKRISRGIARGAQRSVRARLSQTMRAAQRQMRGPGPPPRPSITPGVTPSAPGRSGGEPGTGKELSAWGYIGIARDHWYYNVGPNNGLEDGSRSTSTTLVAGGDAPLNDTLIIGVALAHARTTTELTMRHGPVWGQEQSNDRSQRISPYVALILTPELYIYASAGYGTGYGESDLNAAGFGPPGKVTDTRESAFSIGMEYLRAIGDFGLGGRVGYSWEQISRQVDDKATGIRSETDTDLNPVFEFGLLGSWETDGLVLNVSADYEYQFIPLVGLNGSTFDRDSVILSLSADVTLDEGVTLTPEINTTVLRNRYNSFGGSLNLRVGF